MKSILKLFSNAKSFWNDQHESPSPCGRILDRKRRICPKTLSRQAFPMVQAFFSEPTSTGYWCYCQFDIIKPETNRALSVVPRHTNVVSMCSVSSVWSASVRRAPADLPESMSDYPVHTRMRVT